MGAFFHNILPSVFGIHGTAAVSDGAALNVKCWERAQLLFVWEWNKQIILM